MDERFEIQRTIPAEPGAIFEIVSSPEGHVAIDASGMLQSWTGEPAGAGAADAQDEDAAFRDPSGIVAHALTR